MKKIIAVGVLMMVVTGALMISSVAYAGSYPPGAPQLTTDHSTVVPGEAFVVSGDGCGAGVQVTIRVGDTIIGTTTTDSTGHFSLSVLLPSGLPVGSYTVTSSCPDPAGDTLVLSTVVTLVSTLSKTGTDVLPIVLVGMASLLVGGGLVSFRRRRSLTAA